MCTYIEYWGLLLAFSRLDINLDLTSPVYSRATLQSLGCNSYPVLDLLTYWLSRKPVSVTLFLLFYLSGLGTSKKVQQQVLVVSLRGQGSAIPHLPGECWCIPGNIGVVLVRKLAKIIVL